jgi:hypothetical protein
VTSSGPEPDRRRSRRRRFAECVDDVGDLEHPALQQVTDPPAAFEQIDRRFDLDVCREEQDPDLRELGPDRAGRVETLPRLCGRHADVDHREVRELLMDNLVEGSRIAGLADHVEPRPIQEACDPLAQKNIVLGHDDAEPGHLAE